ncbi:MAG TPA: hypothetical protein PKU97_11785 [Kofleriaceae bacterium]|nr:hypothetical protein [Kofleriaceae bacterium]
MSLELSREVTCIRSMAWRCDLPSQLNWPALVAQMLTFDLTQQQAAVKGLTRLVSPRGDEIIFVAASGRVQIRVHYTVPEEQRRFVAERLFQHLVYALRRI